MNRIVSGQAASQRWYERHPRGVPVGIFLLTSAVTLLSVFAIESSETQRRDAQLNQAAASVTSSLERRISANAAYLRSGAILFATQQVVEAPLFETFIGQLQQDMNYPGAEGIGWAMRIDKADIATVEEGMRRLGSPAFRVHPLPADEQAYAVPIMYLQPQTERNRRALGFNMYSEPVRRAAMQRAERFAEPTASGKVTLLQQGSGTKNPGFLIYMPVFDARPGSGRRLKGFVYSPFSAGPFFRSSIELDENSNVGLSLYDRFVRPENLLARVPVDNPTGRKVIRSFEAANHPWILVVESGRTESLSNLSLLTLLFGLLVASLLLVLARLVTQQATEDRKALEWFEEQASIRNSLTRELNHRVKNTLANVLSIVSLTKRRARDLDSFTAALEGRIRALSATHDLLTQSEWGTTPIRAVVTAELAPYALESSRHLKLGGPDVELAPNDALSLGLAIHELATNAAKYGALSVLDGTVTITWKLITRELARVEWVESGGPPVSPQRRRGFGTELIEKIVAHELRNPVDLQFEPEGVRCSLILPVRLPATFQIRERPGSAAGAARSPAQPA
jgi:two-component sensor histidine kinase/CHASE1-domain containing sensor protein